MARQGIAPVLGREPCWGTVWAAGVNKEEWWSEKAFPVRCVPHKADPRGGYLPCLGSSNSRVG